MLRYVVEFVQLGKTVPRPAQDGWRAMCAYPHFIFFPAAAIFLTILAFNTLGNALREHLDPKSN